ncbi:internalin A [Paenibacillus castaneae]|uniref:stalk domain-containing protein n=1 Tax=Paenibacillus castaneae TaxID=474957 RepID=UPI000C9C53A2|nr:leucine-rich repeat domain-containing protein [Paenibacillus castaneae]NIK79041.1 internalin A [Paenibacillus castaneae]
MKKVITGLLLMLVISLGLSGQASADQASLEASSKISFHDEKLEQAIRQILDKNEDEAITKQEMESLTDLNLAFKGIKSVQGLQYATNLTNLNLYLNEIADIEPLAALKQIRYLDLSYNQIDSIGVLSSLKNLESLTVNGNNLTSIDVVKHFPRLNELGAGANHITDIQVLTTLKDLTWLKLNDNPIANFEPISKLTKIINLDLENNKISDLKLLKPLSKSLMNLHIGGNQITDLNALEGLSLLRSLYAENNQIKVITPLRKLTNLEVLNLNNNLVYDLEPLRSLKKISNLYLANNRIWNIEPISNHRFDTHFDTGAIRYGLDLTGNYLDLRNTTKSYMLLNKLAGDGHPLNQLKAQRLVIGSTTAYVGESAFKLSTAPFIVSQRTYVPVRFVSERLGANVAWNQSKKEVTIVKDGKTIRWVVDKKTANVNGKTVAFDTPLLLKKGTTFVPVRFVSELLESSVEYIPSSKSVLIFEKK